MRWLLEVAVEATRRHLLQAPPPLARNDPVRTTARARLSPIMQVGPESDGNAATGGDFAAASDEIRQR